MMKYKLIHLLLLSVLSLGLCVGAQASSYQIGQNTLSDQGLGHGANGSSHRHGPVRLARFSYVQGNITWRPSANTDWSPASVNIPLRQGAQVWVTNGGRAEIQFDDGSLLRLGSGAIVTLQTLYSDSYGEYTELKMDEGLCTLHLLHADSIYQVDTPLVSIKSVGPSQVRIGVNSGVEVADQGGHAVLEGSQGKTVLNRGDYIYLADRSSRYRIEPLPMPDRWDRWNRERNNRLAQAARGNHLPPDIALVAGNLDNYGTWHHDSRYGWIWSPTVTNSSWRPYEHGRWVWTEPFGWTWVASENWGWAPFHYGTWVDQPYGWAWVPGPESQYWSPAVVDFSDEDGDIGWCPLAPDEVRYPSELNFGFQNGNWETDFSIGGSAVYYPENGSYFAPSPWDNNYVNQTIYTTNNNNYENNNSGPHSIHPTRAHFIPQNAGFAPGVTTASAASFGGAGTYHPLPQGRTFFARGEQMSAVPRPGHPPFAGPAQVRPSALSYTPTRVLLPSMHPAASLLARPVYRAPLPLNADRTAPPMQHIRVPSIRPIIPTQQPVHFFPGNSRPAQQAAAARRSLGYPQRVNRPQWAAPIVRPLAPPAAPRQFQNNFRIPQPITRPAFHPAPVWQQPRFIQPPRQAQERPAPVSRPFQNNSQPRFAPQAPAFMPVRPAQPMPPQQNSGGSSGGGGGHPLRAIR